MKSKNPVERANHAPARDPGTNGNGKAPSAASGGGLSGVAIRRPVFTAMLMLGLVVLGLFSFRQLAIDQFPNVDIPVVVVQTVYAGASPETIEREVTQRMEEAFNPVEGVDRITSVSLEGVSQIIVEFDLGRDVDQASQDIRAKIESVRRELPDDIEAPIVQKFDPSALPILSLALFSDNMPIAELTTLADETVRRQLETVSGVGEVRLAGGREREIRVYLLPDQMQARGVSVTEIMNALRSQNLEVPAGRLERGNEEQLVRVTGRITDPRQFEDVIVANRNGTPIRLGQVARVEDATEEERSLALVNGKRAVSLDILKVSGANTVTVADGVKEAIENLHGVLPEGAQLQVVRDNSVSIRQSVHDVISELILGAILTVIIVMLFLNDWKATTITAMALPVSVISAFILMNLLGFTLNVISLMALSLSIGILIDDAIVVIENIVRHRELGQNQFLAAATGTREIFLAVMATTLTIVAVFVPVAFMGGIIGRFFFQFGMTVAWAVLVSLFVSFTLTPMLSAWWGVSPHGAGHGRGNVFTRTIGGFNTWFDNQSEKYRGVIAWALRHRKATLGLAAASLVGAFMLMPFIGGGFMPPSDESQFAVTFETPEGSSLAYTRSKAEEITTSIRKLPQVDYTYTTIGAGATGTVTNGEVYVKLVPPGERDLSQDEMLPVVRQELENIYGADIAVLSTSGVGGAQAPIAVEIRGPDVNVLQDLSEQVALTMRQIPGIVDVQTSMDNPRPEYRINVNRDLANEIGLDVGQIASTVRPVLAGQDVTTWQDPTGEERDVVVQVAPEQRTSLTNLTSLPIATSQRSEGGSAVTVSLGQVARIEQGTAPAQIDRKDLQRIATVSAGTAPDFSVSEASSAITDRVDEMELPAGYSVSLGGETEQLQETVGYVLEAIFLAIILIFLILASQFESFTQPFAIMLSLPLSLVGVLLALLITNDTLNMMSMIGVIMLMGLVTKNAILLVDNANERRGLGRDRFTALVEAGHVRLRPIMMTTLAMIAGMLPIALALGEGGGFRAPMARAVIGGLITSTLLTLVVVPVAYTYFDDFGTWMKHKFVSDKQAHELEEAQAEAGLLPETVLSE
ncbi:MAG TPA: efflux RND transporter permease subunit [Rhodothermales bacterium]|nr:efflux RND transporter permease subunit [Rhodothermales bacterium]